MFSVNLAPGQGRFNGGARAENGGVVRPADLVIQPPAADGTSNLELPLQLTPDSGTCLAAAYDRDGSLLSIGSREFREAENGVLHISMDLTGWHHIKIFGLNESGAPFCSAAVKPA